MQSHPRKCDACLASTAWLGSKFFGAFTRLVVKCTTSAECKTVITAVLSVMSGLDPHMIIEFEYEIKSWFHDDDDDASGKLWLIMGWYILPS